MRVPIAGFLILLMLFAPAPVCAWQFPGAGGTSRDLKLEISELPAGGKRWALLIGITNYHDKNISPLPGAVNDAVLLAETLKEHAGFPEDQVILLTTEQKEERQPTRVNILQKLSTLSHVVPKDGLLLVSFSGHGISRGRDAYLITSDGRLSNDVRFLAETAISVGKIREWIRESGIGQVIVLLDSCRNEPAGRSGINNVYTENYNTLRFDVANREVKAFATLFAADLGQRAFEFAEKKQGYFSWALVEGLKGAAQNDRGEVTLASLKRYVEDTVSRKTLVDLGPEDQQRPIAWVEGYRAEELVLAVHGSKGEEIAGLRRANAAVPAVIRPRVPTAPLPGSARKNEVDGLLYVLVPAGEFDMGCAPLDLDCFDNETPRHRVEIGEAFRITKTPITVGAFKRFCSATGHRMPPEPGYSNGRITIPNFNPEWKFEDHPVVNVTWHDARAYCTWAGGRLPTEAEWEYAARGGRPNLTYPWGNFLSPDDANYRLTTTPRDAIDQWPHTSPVSSFPPNGFQLTDMAGNVYQWTADWYHPTFFRVSPIRDPQGPATGDGRVAKGGSWSNDARFLRTSVRTAFSPRERSHYLGFRCVLLP